MKSFPCRSVRILIGLASFQMLTWPAQVAAHHDPADVVAKLSEQIASTGPTARLLVRRGDERRALGQHARAAADYDQATQLDARNPTAWYGLARTRIDLGQFKKAIVAAEAGVALTTTIEAAAPYHALLAEAHDSLGADDRAIDAWSASLESARPDVDWFLGQARTFTRLERHSDARNALAAALERNPSVVLRRAWIETLIRSGDGKEARKEIDAGLMRSRSKASWLLLSAELYEAQGDQVGAKQCAEAALYELNTRITPEVANPLLQRLRVQAQQRIASLSHRTSKENGSLPDSTGP